MSNESMTVASDEEFAYPTGYGVLRSVDEYRRLYLPAAHDLRSIDCRFTAYVNLVRAHAVAQGRWLDYGCGVGTFPYHLGASLTGWQVEGWDSDFASYRIAEECFARSNVGFRREGYDAYQSLPAAGFDGISLLEVIEHVDNPGAILRAFRAALRPRGLLLVSTPNFLGFSALNLEIRRIMNELIRRRDRSGYVKLMNDAVYNPATEAGHVVLYSPPTLAMMLKSHGFELVTFDLVAPTRRLLHRLLPDTLIMLARCVD